MSNPNYTASERIELINTFEVDAAKWAGEAQKIRDNVLPSDSKTDKAAATRTANQFDRHAAALLNAVEFHKNALSAA